MPGNYIPSLIDSLLYSRTGKLSALPGVYGKAALLNLLLLTFLVCAFTAAAQVPQNNSPEAAADVNEDELAKDSTTEINVKNAEITAIIRIFSKKTKRNFILDERVKGKVSIYLPGKVSTEESIRILDSVLAYKGFVAVPIGDNLWKIVPSKEARQSTIPTKLENPDGKPSPSMVTRLVQLKYISSDEARQVITPLVSADGLLNAYAGTNSLIIIDSESNISRLIGILENLDVPFANRDMTIIPVRHADATDLAAKLNEILGLGTSSAGAAREDSGLDLLRARMREIAGTTASLRASTNPSAVVQQATSATASDADSSAVNAARSHQPKIIADERTNSLIIVADEETTARIQALVAQLDSRIDLSGSRFWVYRCQHAKADDLATVLSGLSGVGGSTAGRSTGESGGLQDLISGNTGTSRTGSSGRSTSLSRSQQRIESQRRVPGQSRISGGSRSGSSSVKIGEDISITADPATNSLIIFANKNDYLKIKALLEKLDIKRRQVLVEATLLEVGIDDSHQASTSWIVSGGGKDGAVLGQSGGSDIISLLTNPTAVQDFSIAAASAGTLSIGDVLTIPTQSLLISALETNSNVNVLSAPTLLTTDNEEAEIVVGENVPFIASTSTTEENLNNTFNQVDRQDVGITLRLTPQISSDDNVTLKVFTEVSNVKETDPRLGPTTTVRTSETNIIARDGQMIVIGGLMADGVTESERGVPYLEDIPLLGFLFERSTKRFRRTNLLILLTPRIVKDQFDARDYTLDGAAKMEQEIDMLGLSPERREVLRNSNMDRVAESEFSEESGPSTIFPPKKSESSAAASKLDAPLLKQQSGREAVEFEVRPRFSSPPGADTLNKTEKIAPSGISNPGNAFNNADNFGAATRGESFIVLKLKGNPGDADLKSLPFQLHAGQYAMLRAPPSDLASTVKHFQHGKIARYSLGQESIEFESLGTFGSLTEAQAAAPDLPAASSERWYTLSPYEIINLGRGPWR